MKKHQKSNRHKSNEIGKHIINHCFNSNIYINNHGKICNLIETSGKVTINGTPIQNESTQRLNIKVDKRDAQTSKVPNQNTTIAKHSQHRVWDKLVVTLPIVVLLATGTLVAKTLLKKRA